MNKPNPKVDAHLRKTKKWQLELEQLRQIILTCDLTEEFKWAKPCYTYQAGNLAILCGLKDSCAIGFMKGALLKDPERVLDKPGENSQSMRWMKFTSSTEITELKPTIEAYLREAIAAEKSGVKIEFKKSPEPIPPELKARLDKTPVLKKAFTALTPGRQRAYILLISAAKQSATREARIEKCLPQILAGKGIHDGYRSTKK